MIRIDVEMVDAVGDVVLVKSGMDVSGNGEPAQGVRPEVAEVGFFLTGGVVRAGEDDRGVRFKGVIQLDFVAVRIGEGGGKRDGRGQQQAERQHQRENRLFHGCKLLLFTLIHGKLREKSPA